MDDPTFPSGPTGMQEAYEATLAHEDALRRCMRQLSPTEFLPALAQWHREHGSSPSSASPRWVPSHTLIHASEANCAYTERYAYKPIKYKYFAQAINATTSCGDAPTLHVLKDSPDLFSFMLLMFRTQFESQVVFNSVLVSRAARVFSSSSIPTASIESFRGRFGLSPTEWIKGATTVYAMTDGSKDGVLPVHFVDKALKDAPRMGYLAAFLREAATTPADIGDHYRKCRFNDDFSPRTSPLLWIHARPRQARKPLVHLTQDIYVQIVESTLANSLWSSLHDRVSELPADMQHPFTRAFSQYIGDLFTFFVPNALVTNLDTIGYSEKHPDWLVDLPDCRLLIECKSSAYGRRYATPKALFGDGFLSTAAHAATQLGHFSRCISTNRVNRVATRPGVPTYHVIATFGRFPLVNSDEVRRHISSHMNRSPIANAETPDRGLPETMSTDAIEALVLLLRQGRSFSSLWNTYMVTPSAERGDWPEYLRNLLHDTDAKPDYSFWQSHFHDLLDEVRDDLKS